MDIVQRAIAVAAKAHQNQLRKGTNIPYISHPFGVGMLLQANGYPANVVAAGILHDTLEDTVLTEADLRLEFGTEVTQIVVGCSEADKTLSWEERKAHKIAFIKHAAPDIKAVTCADKLHNLQSTAEALQQLGNQAWDRFKRGKKDQEQYYRAMADSIATGLHNEFPLLRQLRETIDHVFGVEPLDRPIRTSR